jgi:hypothetical protein
MRNLKHDIKVRPVFLQNDDRIRASAFLTVLALTVYSLIKWLAQERGIGLTGRKGMGLFAGIGLLKQKDGQKRSIFYLLGVEPRHG